MPDLNPTDLIIGAAALVGAIAVLWKPIRKGANLLRAIAQFTEDWNGQAERRDKSGRLIEPARAGVPALLESVRNQVQNSHSTNLRDDLDEVKKHIGTVENKLDEHIEIAKEVEERQEETAVKVDKLAEDVGVLRGRYAPDRKPNDPKAP